MSVVMSGEALRLLALLAQKSGISKSAALRISIQEMAKTEGIENRGGL
jgi:hypothetical protein